MMAIQPPPLPDLPTWYQIARKELDKGVKEVAGPKSNARILEYHHSCTSSIISDEVAWCAAFVGWCLREAGVKSTGSSSARSYMDYGIKLETPKVGCIVVFSRPPKPGQGHVAFYVGKDVNGDLIVLGGNQGNRVSTSTYPSSRLLSHRWPFTRADQMSVPMLEWSR